MYSWWISVNEGFRLFRVFSPHRLDKYRSVNFTSGTGRSLWRSREPLQRSVCGRRPVWRGVFVFCRIQSGINFPTVSCHKSVVCFSISTQHMIPCRRKEGHFGVIVVAVANTFALGNYCLEETATTVQVAAFLSVCVEIGIFLQSTCNNLLNWHHLLNLTCCFLHEVMPPSFNIYSIELWASIIYA